MFALYLFLMDVVSAQVPDPAPLTVTIPSTVEIVLGLLSVIVLLWTIQKAMVLHR